MHFWKLGTIWGKGAPNFYDIIQSHCISIGHSNDGYPKKNDIILVTKGYTVYAITVLLEDGTPVNTRPELEKDFQEFRIPFDDDVLVAKSKWYVLDEKDRFKYRLQNGICRIHKTDIINTTKILLKRYKEMNNLRKYLDLLSYKKQIVLQGPPGTGKTRLAKIIAENLVPLTQELIFTKIHVGHEISTIAGEASYEVTEIDQSNGVISLKNSDEATKTVRVEALIASFNEKSWETKPMGNDERIVKALAKYIFDSFFEDNHQIKLIQFHPSYNYEDFVRGIEAKTNGGSVEYQQVNKILGNFSAEALDNYLDSRKSKSVLNNELSFREQFSVFKDKIVASLANGEYFDIPSTTAEIVEVGESVFKYQFKGKPGYIYTLIFDDFFKIHDTGRSFETSTGITRIDGLLERKSAGTYYFHLYKEILKIRPESREIDIPRQLNYILIIDEINRANLSSVLGELIYALEYRGSAVESIYEVSGSKKLVLPPNLLIIGTMNTADRSVGHIDYAIRRRFAFVDVLPEQLELPTFNTELYKSVEAIFDKNLSAEFDKKDVQLGHSYFIDKSDENGSMEIRLEYEIKPLLREYVKDGILIGTDILDMIEAL